MAMLRSIAKRIDRLEQLQDKQTEGVFVKDVELIEAEKGLGFRDAVLLARQNWIQEGGKKAEWIKRNDDHIEMSLNCYWCVKGE